MDYKNENNGNGWNFKKDDGMGEGVSGANNPLNLNKEESGEDRRFTKNGIPIIPGTENYGIKPEPQTESRQGNMEHIVFNPVDSESSASMSKQEDAVNSAGQESENQCVPHTSDSPSVERASAGQNAESGAGRYSSFYDNAYNSATISAPKYSYTPTYTKGSMGYKPNQLNTSNTTADAPQYNIPKYEFHDRGDYKEAKTAQKQRTLIIAAGAVCSVLVLFLGSFAGTVFYNYYNNGSENIYSNSNPSRLEIIPTPDSDMDGQAAQPVSSTGELTVEQIAEKVTPSVVGVVTESYSNIYYGSTASGIIMSEDGYIITNHHVVSGSDKISVVLNNGDTYTARLIGSDEKTDIAVLRIDATGLQAAEFGNSDDLKQGSLAVAIGNPVGIQLRGTVTQGCISAVNRDVIVENRTMNLIQTDASINPGNSGGPLVNKYGQVVGINSVKIGISYYEGLGFAIPINTVKPIVDELIEYGYVTGRPAIGITGKNISARSSISLGYPQGVLIDSVSQQSDAARKGLAVNDIITAVNGERIYTMQQISTIKDNFQVGDDITLTVYRNGQSIDITFQLVDETVISH